MYSVLRSPPQSIKKSGPITWGKQIFLLGKWNEVWWSGWQVKLVTAVLLAIISNQKQLQDFKAPAKRSQYSNTTYPNIVGSAFASPCQRIATFKRNISQHCWAQHVAHVWPPCCDMLGIKNRCSAHWPDQTTTTSRNIRKCCLKNLTIFKF